MGSLPDDMMDHIAGFFTLWDWNAAMCVNHQWGALCRQQPLLTRLIHQWLYAHTIECACVACLRKVDTKPPFIEQNTSIGASRIGTVAH